MSNILIFGDSITHGVYLEKGHSWADKLKSEKQSYNPYDLVFNLGIPGDTVKGVLNRYKLELIPRWSQGDTLLFSIGINDSHIYYSNEDDYFLSEDDFGNDICSLIDSAKKITNNIIFIGLTIVDEDITNPFPISETGKCFSNNRIKKFDNIIKEKCRENNIGFIEMFDLLTYDDFTDGLHPGNMGQEKMYVRIRDYLNDLKRK